MRIGLMGLGYVGLPLAVAFAERGHEVIGVDTDPAKIEAIRERRSYVEDIPSERLAAVAAAVNASRNAAGLSDADAVIIAVPTPLTANREPDLGALLAAGQALAQVLRPGQLVVLESTTYPGTTRERLLPLLEESGLRAGADFHLAFSPERVDPGRTDHTLWTTPKVVGGLTDACRERAVQLYAEVCERVVPVSTPEIAEMSKLLENIFRSVNIALVNEMAVLCDRMGIDIWEVVDAAATKPYGFMRFEPGPGLGGHCLPIDPFYLAWRAREYDMPTEFIELAGEVHQRMPFHCAQRVARALNGQSKPVRGSRIAVIGVSYKAGVGDIREAPALKIMALLAEDGADLTYHDEHVPVLGDMRSEPLERALEGADAAVIVTAHPGIDLDLILRMAPVVVDLRGVTRASAASHVVRL